MFAQKRGLTQQLRSGPGPTPTRRRARSGSTSACLFAAICVWLATGALSANADYGGTKPLPEITLPMSPASVTAGWSYSHGFILYGSDCTALMGAGQAASAFPSGYSSGLIHNSSHGGSAESELSLAAPLFVPGGPGDPGQTKVAGRITATAIAPDPYASHNETMGRTTNANTLTINGGDYINIATHAQLRWSLPDWDSQAVGADDAYRASERLYLDNQLQLQSDWLLVSNAGTFAELSAANGLHLASQSGLLASFAWTGADPFTPGNNWNDWAQLVGGQFSASPALAALPWQFTYDGRGIADAVLPPEYFPGREWTSPQIPAGTHSFRYTDGDVAEQWKAIPEPSGLVLMSVASSMLLGRRRR
jgi:hypothetical protein